MYEMKNCYKPQIVATMGEQQNVIRQPEIVKVLEKMQNQIERFRNNLSILFERLSPVLSNPPIESRQEKLKAELPFNCKLATELDNLARQINEADYMLQDILGRLEI